MDRGSLLNDPETAIRTALEGHQAGVWSAMPGVVQSVNLAKMTCTVQLAIQGAIIDENDATQNVNYPVLGDVPIVFPGCAGFLITMPIAAGDEVLVVFASRCIDSWWQNGGVDNQPMEARMHDLSDGFAIPGPYSQPNVAGSISSSDLQIRNKAGTVYLSIGADKKIKLVSTTGKLHLANTASSLFTALTNLNTALSAFMSTLAGFSGGGSPVTQASLQAPAATAGTAITAVQVLIAGLLE